MSRTGGSNRGIQLISFWSKNVTSRTGGSSWHPFGPKTLRHEQGDPTDLLAKNVTSRSALRISYWVSIETRDLETFHSIEEYRVSNVQYRVSSILKNCDLFCLFSPKRSYFKAKSTHFWKFNQVKYFPMELVNFVKGLTEVVDFTREVDGKKS